MNQSFKAFLGHLSFRKTLPRLFWALLFFVLFSGPEMHAENAARVSVGSKTLSVNASVPGVTFMSLRVVDPQGRLVFHEKTAGGSIQWVLQDGSPDGHYSYEVRVGFMEKRARREGDAAPAPAPAIPPRTQSGAVYVRDGAIMVPSERETGLLKDARSLAGTVLSSLMDFLISPASADEVITDDLIVSSSMCVGSDCKDGEVFELDTLRLKETILRIKFEDTSSTAGFASNDWQITVNDVLNGGLNKFAIEDFTGGETPFTIEAGAGTNALYVDDTGQVGLGTSSPFLPLHILYGNTPGVRFEQDASLGYSAQTWDLGGNESNFFVRDETHGAGLPFRIKAGAPTNSLFIKGDGRIGLGTQSPAAALELETQSADAAFLFERVGEATGVLAATEGAVKIGTRTETPFYVVMHEDDGDAGDDDRVLTVDTTGRLGIGTANPTQALHVEGNAYVSANLELGSSRAYKKNIQPLQAEAAVETLRELVPVSYNYRSDPTEESLGFIAEDVPDLVATNSRKTVSPMDLVAVLARVLQEQQRTIEGLALRVQDLEEALNARPRVGAGTGDVP